MDCCVLFDQIELSAVSSKFAVIQARSFMICWVRKGLETRRCKIEQPNMFLVGFEVLVCFLLFLFSFATVFPYVVVVVGLNLWKYVANRAVLNEWSCSVWSHWIHSCFIQGLLSFNSLFVFCWSPEEFENRAFQDITAKWKLFLVWGFWCFFVLFSSFLLCFLLCCRRCWP